MFYSGKNINLMISPKHQLLYEETQILLYVCKSIIVFIVKEMIKKCLKLELSLAARL